MNLVTLHDGSTVKLGRIAPKSRPNVLRFATYLTGATPPPESVDYTVKAKASIAHMYLNDQYGDCVIAGKGHAIGVWTGNATGTPVVGTDQEIYSAYQGICGRGDNGCNIAAVLDYMKSNGLMLGGQRHKIDGYVAIDWTNEIEVKVALYLFGALTIGCSLPSAWASSGDIWDITNTRIVGGHDVTVVGYNSQGAIISTWGSLRTITWPAFTSQRWLDECYAMLSPDWYSNNNLAPSGVDVEQLKADLEKLGGGTIPPIDPNPTPNPDPNPTPNPTPTPVVVGLTLDQAVKAVVDGINNGAPYGMFNVASKVANAAVEALKAAWPTTPPPGPSPTPDPNTDPLGPGDFDMGGNFGH
jgi:hypothetical protein